MDQIRIEASNRRFRCESFGRSPGLFATWCSACRATPSAHWSHSTPRRSRQPTATRPRTGGRPAGHDDPQSQQVRVLRTMASAWQLDVLTITSAETTSRRAGATWPDPPRGARVGPGTGLDGARPRCPSRRRRRRASPRPGRQPPRSARARPPAAGTSTAPWRADTDIRRGTSTSRSTKVTSRVTGVTALRCSSNRSSSRGAVEGWPLRTAPLGRPDPRRRPHRWGVGCRRTP